MDKRQRRKLTVILHADVVGSTILVQRDETLAHDRMQDSFRRFSETIRAYGGSTHELRGDALVAEFDRASDAVCAALAFQADNAQFNDGLDGDVRPELRVGISMGEMVIADRTVTGPGVVLAQRLEQLAEPGGVIVQGAAHETIPRRLPFEYKFLGEREVKGFDEPVRAYAISLTPGQIIPSPEGHAVRKGKWFAASIVGLVLIVAGGLVWFQPWVVREEPASVERMVHSLPDKPSIAVLPFRNMSGDPEQDYFSDGLTENLITTLSQLPDVFVIARSSSFTYKGNPVKVQQVAEEFGVHYVVEGSFQRAGGNIRVHAQFVDALSGIHLWAERYDRPWSDVFVLQDDLTRNIVSSLALKLSDEQRIQLSRHYTNDLEAYDYFLRGQAAFYGYSAEDNARAREMYQRAIDRDPDFARAVAALALTYAFDYRFGWNDANETSQKRAQELSRKALAMDDTLPQVHLVASVVHQFGRDHEGAIKAAQRAITLDPNYADAYLAMAFSQTHMGNANGAIGMLKKAMRLNPNTPSIYYVAMGRALFFTGRLEESKRHLERAAEMNPTFLETHVLLVAVWNQIGDQHEAEWKAEEVLTLEPDFSVEAWLDNEPLVDLTYADTLRKSLLRAGLPERPVFVTPETD